MSRISAIQLQFPMGGVDKRFGRQSQPPYSTPDANNVRPDAVGTGRARGGSRPGIAKAFASQMSTDTAPQLLTSVRSPSGAQVFTEGFPGTSLGAWWNALTTINAFIVAGGVAKTDPAFDFYEAGARLSTIGADDYDAMADVTVELNGIQISVTGEQYKIYLHMDNAGSQLANGVAVSFVLTPAATVVAVGERIAGVNTALYSSGSIAHDNTANTQVKIVRRMSGATPVIDIYSDGVLIHSTNLTLRTGIYSFFGFGAASTATGAGNTGQVSEFKISYTGRDAGVRTFAMSGNKFYRGVTDLALIGTASGNYGNAQYTAVSRLGKVYMTFLSESKIYDYAGDAVGAWTATMDKGAVPLGTVMALYRDRIVIANEQLWYMSRQGDPLDWDYGASDTDPGRAVSGTTSDTGTVGQRITALAAYDDYLIIGCRRSLWTLIGDPATNGQMVQLSDVVGVNGPMAWCRSPEGLIYFLSHDGLYATTPQGPPQAISRDKLPRDLAGHNPDSIMCTLVYDVFAQGVHIFLREFANTSNAYYFYHVPSGSFWPGSFVSLDHYPTVAHVSPYAWGGSNVLLGCGDSYVRRFDEAATTDDGQALSSYALIGPFRAGPGTSADGLLTALEAILGSDSGDVAWSVLAGKTHYAASVATAQVSGTWGDGRNPRSLARVRGPSLILKLAATGKWSMEEITATIKPTGRIRT